MTRRERMERRQQRRLEWSAKAAAKSDARFNAVRRIADGIPFGQPILVGHHSERHARRDQERIHNGMRAALDLDAKAKNHTSKADGIARQLETSIFSDDPDAIESLGAKVAALEAERERYSAENKAFRKALKACGGDKAAALAALVKDGTLDEKAAMRAAKDFGLCPWEKALHPAYSLSNLSGRIRQAKQRIEDVKRRNERTAAAEAAGGVSIVGAADYVSVTFAEFPGRDTINELKAAGFHWSGGSWHGRRDRLPANIKGGAE